jgi:hypothetical protein
MNTLRPIRHSGSESGVALLISIFVLLLICVVAIALVVASGTESALSGNYRSATSAYYAALAGLEEGRGRLLPRNPNYYLNTNPNFLPPPGTPFPVGYVSYVLNPVSGETVAPWDTGTATTYPDKEYGQEFPNSLYPMPTTTPNLQTITSVSNANAAGIQGPLYKWVRINAVTEDALNLDIDTLHSTKPFNQTTPVYYDGAHFNLNSNGAQVLEITSLAVLPNGTQKILQYLTAPNVVSLPPFPAAITLVGNNVDYTGPNSTSWYVNGNDTISLGACAPGLPVYAVGYSNNSDPSRTNINQGTFTGHAGNYTGQGGATPNLGYIGPAIPANLQKPSGLNGIVQNITQNADSVIPSTPPPPGPVPTFHGSDLPSGMSPTNLMTIVVNGNLDLTSWHNTGYGLLLVTGTLTYDPDASWYGIVLVIGSGRVTGSHMGIGKFTGAMFVSQIYDSTGALAADPNMPDAQDLSMEFDPAMGGNGVYYSSCWIKAATPTGAYQMLSFHEISQ